MSNILLLLLDIIVQIQPSDVLVSLGDTTEFSCNFTGQHRVRREQVTWFKGKNILLIFLFHHSYSLDGQPLLSDGTRITTSMELPDATITVLHIVASRPSDRGSYRCSDGQNAQSKEAKLYLRDGNINTFLRSLSSSGSLSMNSSFRTVFCLYIFLSLFFLEILY